MVETVDRAVEAAWKVRNLDDFEARLERAAERVDELVERRAAGFVIYESALMKSGRSREDIRALIAEFDETFADPEVEFTIPRVSGVMNAYGDEWFFGDRELRLLTGQLLGQFQHRVAQYNYVSETEVLKRWADSYDTRLFIRRRIYDTEPVVGVVAGFDLAQLQYLRVIAGGDTLVPTDAVAKALVNLGYDAPADGYETLARAEGIALQMEIPSPLVGEMLEELAREDFTAFREPPAPEPEEKEASEEASEEGAEEKPGPEAREARKAARRDVKKGDEPTRVQDPQSKDAPGTPEEAGGETPAAPESGKDDSAGGSAGGEESSGDRG
ncbi:MAG: hypothetical protein H0U65_12740 [Rubrobacter sp.]|nr:hypothetical protein [Rubrobacter sp.]